MGWGVAEGGGACGGAKRGSLERGVASCFIVLVVLAGTGEAVSSVRDSGGGGVSSST